MRSTAPFKPEMELVSVSDSLDVPSRSVKTLTVSCYENEIPHFVKAEMERLYQNVFSSVAAEHVDNANTSTFVVLRDATPIAIFLFRLQEKKVRVLNATTLINEDEIRRFCAYIFSQYKSVATISFQSIQLDRFSMPFPLQKFTASEDIVLTLPNTARSYLNSLGKTTRKSLKYYLNRTKRHFPDYDFRVYEREQIDEQLVQSIIDLNTARMERKNRVSTIDEKHRSWIMNVAKTYGFVGVVTINGRICGGVICSRIEGNYFMHVLAHDPQYDDYRLGTICCYSAICEAIARGGVEYHFLWGQGDYKYRLLGIQRHLYNLTVYRSRGHYLRNLGLVLHNRISSYIRRAKVGTEKNARGNRWASKAAARLLGSLQNMQCLKHRMAAAVREMLSSGSSRK